MDKNRKGDKEYIMGVGEQRKYDGSKTSTQDVEFSIMS